MAISALILSLSRADFLSMIFLLLSAFVAVPASVMSGFVFSRHMSLLRRSRYLEERAKAKIAATDVNAYAESERRKDEAILQMIKEGQDASASQIILKFSRAFEMNRQMITKIDKESNAISERLSELEEKLAKAFERDERKSERDPEPDRESGEVFYQ